MITPTKAQRRLALSRLSAEMVHREWPQGRIDAALKGVSSKYVNLFVAACPNSFNVVLEEFRRLEQITEGWTPSAPRAPFANRLKRLFPLTRKAA